MTEQTVPLPMTDVFVTSFAEFAAEAGWSQHALCAFAGAAGVRDIDVPSVRRIARRLNEIADARLRIAFDGLETPSLEQVILVRFQQNATFKSAVASLAKSDVLHPWDTLGRTAVTADTMLNLCGTRGLSKGGRRWRLIFAYSLCVLFWLATGTTSNPPPSHAVRRSLSLFGLR